MAQWLRSIEIQGFTSIGRAVVPLGDVNVLVGANGAGKSNFVRAFELLGRIANQELGRFVGFNGGASALRHGWIRGPGIRIAIDAFSVGYEATLVPAANDELIFDSEILFVPGADEHRLTDQEMIGSGNRETRLKYLVDADNSVASRVLDLLSGCRVFHFHDTSLDAPVKQFISTADNEVLRGDAGNLAAVLLALRDSAAREDQAAYRRIIGAIRQVAPFFRDFVLRPENNDLIRLRWQHTDSDAVFSANQLSDGTLRFMCLVTLLLHPRRPALVVLDEPELGLHPYAITQLAGLLRQAAVHGQVLIATQSVTLMNQFELSEIIVAERDRRFSVFSRPDPDRLREWLDTYSLGELWEKNLIGGRPGDRGSQPDV